MIDPPLRHVLSAAQKRVRREIATELLNTLVVATVPTQDVVGIAVKLADELLDALNEGNSP